MKVSLSFNKNTLKSGAFTALIGFLLSCLCGQPAAGLIAMPFLITAWCVSVVVENQQWRTFAVLALAGISSVLAFLLAQTCLELLFFLGHVTKERILLNISCYVFCIALTCLITGNPKFSIVFTMSGTMVLATANYYTTIFRGREMTMPDLLSVRTAVNVMGGYNFEPSFFLVLAWLMFVVWIIFLSHGVVLPKSKEIYKRSRACAAALISLALIYGLTDYVYTGFILVSDFGGSRFNGFLVNFIFRSQFIEKPETYNQFDFSAVEERYGSSEQQSKKPNVIVIMGEAFSDMRIFGGEINTSAPVTPFIDTLSENTIKGDALASVYGGSTCNSEYEFLTGNTLAFLPEGCIPYQQYVIGETYSLAHYLDALGYETVATHPNIPEAWDRDKVWTSLGFQETIFLDQYDQSKAGRGGYISDRHVFEIITNTIEEKEPGIPLFMYAVTIKNHGPYGQDGSEQYTTIRLNGYSQDYPGVEEYLSLMNETDTAVQYLLEYLSEYEEDTIVLFYGDHQPAFRSGIQEELRGKPFDGLDDTQILYTVPYFIWANYDIPEEEKELSSLNYLSNYLLEAAGMELPPYGKLLKDVETVIPAINALGYYSKKEGRFLAIKDAHGEEKQAISDYSCVAYNAIRPGKRQSEVFFGRYIN